MATPAQDEYAELVGASSTILLGSAAIIAPELTDLRTIGGSRGADTALGGIPGRLARTRVRDSFKAVVPFKILGRYDQDGALVADPVANGLVLQALLRDFPDSEDRAFTVRYTWPAGTEDAGCTFEEFGPWGRPSPDIWVGSYILTVQAGVLS